MKLSVHNLNKSYHGRAVLNLPKAEFGRYSMEGLIGPNGAGKSTLMGLLTRRVSATTGNINFEIDQANHNLMLWQAHQVAQIGLVKTNQRIQGFESLSIRDSLRLAATSSEDETLKSMFAERQHSDEIEAEIDVYLDKFSFQEPDCYAK